MWNLFMNRKSLFIIGVLTVSLLPILSVQASASVGLNISPNLQIADVKAITESIDIQNIMDHVSVLSSFDTRVTGYPGANSTAEYIADQFSQAELKPYGEDAYFDYYPVTVPIDRGAAVILSDGTVLEAFSLWPNMIQECRTPPEGIKGELIYAGYGSLESFTAEEVEGSIVLMEFNSGDKWIRAASLGAKAVIFMKPSSTTRLESETKFTLTPLNFPRVYVNDSEAIDRLLGIAAAGAEVTVKSGMSWETVTAMNVVGMVEGYLKPKEIVFITAYYDDWSVVPMIAPGADEAVSVSVLIELAKLLGKSENKPAMTVVFVAFSGHYEGLAGSREFVEQYYFSNEVLNKTTILHALINLDLSSDSDQLSYLSQGTGIPAWTIPGQSVAIAPIRIWIGQFILDLTKSLPQYDANRYVIDPSRPRIPTTYNLDSDPSILTGTVSLSYRTVGAYRMHMGHPLSTTELITEANLMPQLIFIYSSFFALTHDETLNFRRSEPEVPSRRFYDPGSGLGIGFAGIVGDIVYYNYTSGTYNYEDLQKYKILLQVFAAPPFSGASGGGPSLDPFLHIITEVKPGSGLSYEVHGLGSGIINQIRSIQSSQPTYAYHAFAYAIDRETGEIVCAPDLGEYGAQRFGFTGILIENEPYQFQRIVLFKAAEVVLFDMIDPERLLPPQTTMNTRQRFVTPTFNPISLAALPMDRNLQSPPLSYGLVNPSITYEPISIVFVPPEASFDIILLGTERLGAWMSAGGLREALGAISGVINNATFENPEGQGYRLKEAGETLSLTSTARTAALNFYLLNKHRLDTYGSVWVTFITAEYVMNLTNPLAQRIQMPDMTIGETYGVALQLWNLQAMAYGLIKSLALDVISVAVFFSMLLVPFSLILERLLFNQGGWKRLAAIMGIFGTFLLILSLMHPGFKLASNILAVSLGFLVFILTIPVFLYIIGQTRTYFGRLGARISGVHGIEVSRVGAAMLSLSMGISNTKKRKFRSSLTMVSVIIMVSSMVALTSVQNILYSRTITVPRENLPYNGLLIKIGRSEQPLSENLIEIIGETLGSEAVTSLRSWAYVPAPRVTAGMETADIMFLSLTGPSGKAQSFGMVMGLTPEEAAVTGLGNFVEGRWFEPFESQACIITKATADLMGYEVGDIFNYLGAQFRIVGLLDGDLVSEMKDLDGSPLNPTQILSTAGGVTIQPVPWDSVLIVPYDFAVKELSAKTYMIAVSHSDAEASNKLARDLTLTTGGNFDVYVGFEDLVSVYHRGVGFEVMGLQSLIVPLVITFLVQLNLIVGSIYERTPEIQVFGSVGLSPTQVGMVFLGEVVVFAVIAGMAGYLIGTGSYIFMYGWGIAPEGFRPNYSSIFTMSSVGISMAIMVVASIYPFYKASKLVTPSLERKWKITTKAVGASWEIPLPVKIIRGEYRGLLRYLDEYLDSLRESRGGAFLTVDTAVTTQVVEDETVEVFEATLNIGAEVRTSVKVRSLPGEDPESVNILFEFNRLSGKLGTWQKSIPSIADTLRKQVLNWTGLTPTMRSEYIKRA